MERSLPLHAHLRSATLPVPCEITRGGRLPVRHRGLAASYRRRKGALMRQGDESNSGHYRRLVDRLGGRLTYANVMSTVAVFIALGGSSYAAVRISGSSIRNHSIAGKKL